MVGGKFVPSLYETSTNVETYWNNVFASFGRMTFELGKFTNLRPSFQGYFLTGRLKPYVCITSKVM